MGKSRRFVSLASALMGGVLAAAAVATGAPTPSPTPSPATVQQDASAARAPQRERAPAPRALSLRVQRLATLGGGFTRQYTRHEPIWVGRPRPRRMLHTRYARG